MWQNYVVNLIKAHLEYDNSEFLVQVENISNFLKLNHDEPNSNL